MNNLRTTVMATGLALAFSLYVPAQQGQTGTAATPGGNQSQSGATAQSQTGASQQSQSDRANQTQSGRTDAASSSRNRLEEAKSMVGPPEQRFMNEVAAGGIAEVQMAQLAQKKAQSDEVKQLAQRIEQAHSNANKELEALATKRGVSLPTSPDPKHQAQMTRLEKLEGAAFDRAYARHMVSEHKKSISKFERASNNLMDTDLKNFASKTLPNLREHLQMAQAAAGQKTSEAATRSRAADTTGSTAGETKK